MLEHLAASFSAVVWEGLHLFFVRTPMLVAAGTVQHDGGRSRRCWCSLSTGHLLWLWWLLGRQQKCAGSEEARLPRSLELIWDSVSDEIAD